MSEKALVLDENLTKEGVDLTPSLWSLIAVCFLANVGGGLVSTIASVFLPTISAEMTGADPSAASDAGTYISALYLVGWALGGICWGFISDRMGRAVSLRLCLASVGILTLLVSLAPSWEAVVALRLLGGFAVGGITVLTMTLLSEVWPVASRSQVMGIVSVGFPVGIFSSGLVNNLVGDWRQAFLIGIVPLLLAAWSFFAVRESPAWKMSGTNRKNDKQDQTLSETKRLLHGAVIFGSMLIVLWSVFSWVPTWVQSISSDSEGHVERGMVMMILGMGGVAGGMLSGWIAKSLGERKAMLICFAGVFTVCLFLFGLLREFSPWVYVGSVFLSFFFGMSQGLLSFYIPQLFPVAVRARATGLCFNAGRFVTAGAVFTLGMLVSFFGGYGNALLAFSLLLIPGFLFVFFSKTLKTKF